MNMDKVLSISPDRVRAQAGVVMEKLDEATIHAVNAELRFHPSTYRMASLGGFIAGGSGGVGSIRWGGLRNFGNILGLKVVTCEAEPRVLDLTGPDILKVAHAYGTNGIIVEAEMPLAAHYDWVDMLVGFDSVLEACAFAEQVALQDGLLCKEISPVAAPVAYDYFNRHRPYIRSREQSVVLLMVAPAAVPALVDFVEFHKGDLLLRGDTLDPEAKAKLPPVYELAWNHTTLRGLKIDPTITYLQTQYPDLAHVKWAVETFGDELPMHIEMTRFDGRVVFSGLPIVRYTSEERLEEIIRMHEEAGCFVFNPHRYTLEEGGMKRTDRAQLAFKKEADPTGILNPGKMIAWDDPDFDFESGRTWLFTGLYTLGGTA
jgi:FAD/FMN-containing dehydrogenase